MNSKNLNGRKNCLFFRCSKSTYENSNVRVFQNTRRFDEKKVSQAKMAADTGQKSFLEPNGFQLVSPLFQFPKIPSNPCEFDEKFGKIVDLKKVVILPVNIKSKLVSSSQFRGKSESSKNRYFFETSVKYFTNFSVL